MTKEEKAVIDLYKDNQTLLNIAVYIGISIERVTKILTDNNIPKRKSGGNQRAKPMVKFVYKNKYDYILFEDLNQGKSYKQYTKCQSQY